MDDRSTFLFGRGTSTGGVYSISGTIGQPDANQHTDISIRVPAPEGSRFYRLRRPQ